MILDLHWRRHRGLMSCCIPPEARSQSSTGILHVGGIYHTRKKLCSPFRHCPPSSAPSSALCRRHLPTLSCHSSRISSFAAVTKLFLFLSLQLRRSPTALPSAVSGRPSATMNQAVQPPTGRMYNTDGASIHARYRRRPGAGHLGHSCADAAIAVTVPAWQAGDLNGR